MTEFEINELFEGVRNEISKGRDSVKISNISPGSPNDNEYWRNWNWKCLFIDLIDRLEFLIEEAKKNATKLHKAKRPPHSVILNPFRKLKDYFRSPESMIEEIYGDIYRKKYQLVSAVLLYVKKQDGETIPYYDAAQLSDQDLALYIEWFLNKIKLGEFRE